MDTTFITDLWTQITNAPIWIVIGLVINVFSFLWRRANYLDNKWIPFMCVGSGTGLYWLLAPIKSISADQRHPQIVMMMFGMILGFASWASQGPLMAYAQKKYPNWFPPQNTDNKPKGLQEPDTKTNEKT